MTKKSKYVSRQPDINGYVAYSQDEHRIWQHLYSEQIVSVKELSCPQFIDGLSKLDLPSDRIPQLNELSEKLQFLSDWSVHPVTALIDFETFFDLLANRKFPVATFIRDWEDINYIKEPDIFHEVFGHCTMLTYPKFADFVHAYGILGKYASHKERVYLGRLFWFTVEFGLIDIDGQCKTYGAGLNSSPGECEYSVCSKIPERRNFKIENVLRTPYRIDIYQKIYYVLESFDQLLDLAKYDLLSEVDRAIAYGDFETQYD